MLSLAVLNAVLALGGLFLLKRLLFSKPPPPFPPGPKPLPLIGNVLDIPAKCQWETFSQWSSRWGDVTSVSAFGQRIVVLSSLDAAIDLLEKRGAKYSDRPVLPMASDLMGWDQILVLTPYGERFREMRRLMHRYFGARGQMEKIQPFYELIETETHRFLGRVLRRPYELVEHINKTAGAIILNITYGYHVQEGSDPLVDLVHRATDGLSIAALPGSFLVDVLPALKWVPAWFPGAGWKRKAAQWRKETEAMCDVPFEMAKNEASRGTGGHNLVSDILGDTTTELQEYYLKTAAGSVYAGGAETTVSSVHFFFLAMTLHLEAQKKAQQEIDAVVGSDRLPTLADRKHLPYTDALVTEVLRWSAIAPLGAPHTSIEDDYYRGYFVPKGTLILVNIWHILRDPEIYPEPLCFRPERFMAEDGRQPEQDPRSATFGFGRRICPGINLADASVFLSCAMTLAAFDISKVVENGVEVTPEIASVPGTICHPLPFKCSIKPRSAKAEALVVG